MYKTENFSCYSMPELFDKYDSSNIQKRLEDFKCSKNDEVQKYLLNNSIEFTKKHQAITYLVYDNKDNLSAYLIAQIGKNDNSDINIDDIFEIIDYYINEFQNGCGGVVEFLESENNEKLITLYQNRGFKIFNIRKSKSGEERKLVQMYRLI